MNRVFRLCLFIGLPAAVLSWGCGQPTADRPTRPTSPPWFEDATERLGLHFVHDPGPTGTYFMPQSIGSGAALFDFDNDGRLDVYLLQNAGPQSSSTNRLFRQGPDGRFHDVSKGSGLDISGHGMGTAVGDVNNDGWPDLLVTEVGRIRLFLNNGDGTFRDVSKEAGLDDPLWATAACFFDYDRDGWLDLVVVNYVQFDRSAGPCPDRRGKPEFCGPQQFAGTVTLLYHNHTGKSSGVRFKDVTVSSGLAQGPGPGLGVVCADFNGDGWPDIFVANDASANRLWINQQGKGTFVDEAVLRGVAFNGMGQTPSNMGIAVGDVNGDGLLDLFSTHLTEELHTLWLQGPPGSFLDRTAAAGLATPKWRGTGFGTVFADFDQDGALDLAVVNGRISRGNSANPDLGPFWTWYAERNQLFAGDGGGRFRDLSTDDEPFAQVARVSRGLACGDVDGDGALDLLVTNTGGAARLYRNVAPNRGHWLLVRALDPALKRDAYGAEVTVRAGTRRWLRLVHPGYSYLCSNDPRAHFGLGQADRVDRIQVDWPDGSREVFDGGPADRLVVLRRGEGRKEDR